MSTRILVRTVVLPLVALVALVGAGVVAAGCGGSGAASVAETSIVRPPDVTLQGCTYTVDDSVPAGMPEGVQTGFPTAPSNQAAVEALRSVQAHGGRAIVTSFTLPAGVALLPGPDTSSTPVAHVPEGRSVLAIDPLVWTDGSGRRWLATFLACGGDQLYWVSVDGLTHADPSLAASVAQTLTGAETAAPYYRTGQTSYLPVRIEGGRLVWVHKGIVFAPARGELIDG